MARKVADLDLPSVLFTLTAVAVLFFLKQVARHGKHWLTFLTEGLLITVGRIFIHSASATLSLRRYARLTLAATRFLHVPARVDRSLEIDSIYVPLTLQNPASPAYQTYEFSAFLGVGNRIRLVGDPGSGKSSLVRRILRDGLNVALSDPEGSRFPVAFELRNLHIPADIAPNALGEFLYETLKAHVSEVAAYAVAECFDNYARSTGLLVLIDGLDEVRTDDYARTEKALIQLSEYLSNLSEDSVIVLTTRLQFHERVRDALAPAFPHELLLKPFSSTDVFEFLVRWPFEMHRREKIHRIYSQLNDRPTIRELCTNPLVLSMYVAESDMNSGQIAPDSRTEFYSTVVDELLVNRRTRQRGEQPARSVLRSIRERLLGELALRHMLDLTQSLNSLEWSEAIEATSRLFGIPRETAEQVFDDLSRDTGLFTIERRRQTYRFIHLTFCEYLAGLVAVRYGEDGWERLLSAHRSITVGQPQHQSRLLETIPFACGLMQPRDQSAAIEDVSALNDLQLLARTFLETKSYDHPAWMRFVAAQMESLRRASETTWTYEDLMDLHVFNVVVRDAERARVHAGVGVEIDLDTFVRDLIDTRHAELKRLLTIYASRDAASVFRVTEVAGIDLPTMFPEIIVHNCDQRPFFELLREKAFTEPARVQMWASLFAEAALRSRLVAEEMYAMDWWPGWAGAVPAQRSTAFWFDKRMLEKSFLTQSLTIAVGATSIPPAATLVGQLRTVPAPSRYSWRMSLALDALLMVPAITAVGAVAFFTLDVSSLVSKLTTAGVWLALLTAAVTLPLHSLLSGHRRQLLNTYLGIIGIGDELGDEASSRHEISQVLMPSILRAGESRFLAARRSEAQSS
jgi:NACHT domain